MFQFSVVAIVLVDVICNYLAIFAEFQISPIKSTKDYQLFHSYENFDGNVTKAIFTANEQLLCEVGSSC